MLKKNDWFLKICESYLNPPVFHNDEQLPAFPSDEIQANTTGQAGVGTLREGNVFYQDCANKFKELGSALSRNDKLMDFGVGWGRIARFFLHDLPKDNIFGADVTEDYVRICKETFRNDNFFTCDPFPPTSFVDEQMNFVVGYSVFSHLSEEACASWMREFHRILVPGGIVAVTTRGRPFFDYCESLKGKGHTGYSEGLANMFSDFDSARARYDNGEFVHSNSHGVTGGGAMNAEFYGESFIPESYAQSAYSDYFVLEDFLYDPSRQTHPIMFFRKQ